MIDSVFSNVDIESVLCELTPSFIDEKEPAAMLLPSLVKFLVLPVNHQYHNIFVELHERHASNHGINQS